MNEESGWRDRALFTAAGDPHSALAALAVQPYQDALTRNTQFANSRMTIKIGAVLSAEHRNILQDKIYPHLNLIFQSNVASSHGLAFARRMIEQELVLRKCVSSERICDIGGNWAVNLRMGRVNLHCCCPLIDARDAQRQVTREYETRRWLDKVYRESTHQRALGMDPKLAQKRMNAEFFRNNRGEIYCSKRAELCGKAAHTLIFNDSLYDMSLATVADILDTKEARIAYGNITFSSEMLYSRSGYIKGMDCHWRRFTDKQHGKEFLKTGEEFLAEKIEYFFEDCSNLSYTHNFRDIVLLATQQSLRTRKGNTYLIERTCKHGMMNLVFTRVFNSQTPSRLSFRMWREEVRGKVLVRLYEYCGVSNANREAQITHEEVLVDEALYEGVLSYALRLDGDKFTEENIFSYTCSKNARMILNGVDLTVTKSESVERAYKLAFTVWFIAFMMKYQQSMIHGAFCTREMRNRSLRQAGWTKLTASLLVHTLSKSLYDNTMADGENLLERFIGKARDYMSRINEGTEKVPRPSATLPEPSISVVEYLDVLERDYEPYEPPYERYDEYDRHFTDKESIEQLQIVLDNLADELRRNNLSDEKRATLEEMYRDCVKKLAFKDTNNFTDVTKPWNQREQSHRTLDNTLKNCSIPFENVSETHTSISIKDVDDTLRRHANRLSDKHDSNETDLSKLSSVIEKVVGSHKSSVVCDNSVVEIAGTRDSKVRVEGDLEVRSRVVETADSPSEDENSDSTLKPEDSLSNLKLRELPELRITCHDEYVAFKFIEKFRNGFSILNVSGAGGLCGVRALYRALKISGVDCTEESVFEQLKDSNPSSETSWFTLADLVSVTCAYQRNTILLRNDEVALSSIKPLELYGNIFDKSWDAVYIYHCNNHWQYLNTHSKYRPNITIDFDRSKQTKNDIDEDQPAECVDEGEYDALGALGIDLGEIARAPESKYDHAKEAMGGGGRTIKYVRDRFYSREVLGDAENTKIEPSPDETTPLIDTKLYNPMREKQSEGRLARLKNFFIEKHNQFVDRKIAKATAMAKEQCDKNNLRGEQMDYNTIAKSNRRRRKNILKTLDQRCGYYFGTFAWSREYFSELACAFWLWFCYWFYLISPKLYDFIYSTVYVCVNLIIAILSHSTVMTIIMKTAIGPIVFIFVKLKLIQRLFGVSKKIIEYIGSPHELIVTVGIVILIHLILETRKNISTVATSRRKGMSDTIQAKTIEMLNELKKSIPKFDTTETEKPLYNGHKEFREYNSLDALADLKELRNLSQGDSQTDYKTLNANVCTTNLINFKSQVPNEKGCSHEQKREINDDNAEILESKPSYALVSTIDRERIARDRNNLVKSYLEYLNQSVTNFRAHCDFIWTQRTKFGEKFFQAQFKREKNVANAHVLTTAKAGIFDLPRVYTQHDEKGLTLAYVPSERLGGELRSAVVKDGKLLVEGSPIRIMIFVGMLEYLDYMILQAVLKLDNIQRIDATRRFRLIDGVPGCAKSTEIVRTVKNHDMIAVASRAANFELQDKLIKARKNPAISRTIGSRIMGRKETCERLFVDEGLKVHPGELIILAEICCCKEMIVFGDSKQNTFNPRVPGYVMPDNPMHWSTELRTESKTMPRDAVVAVGRLQVNGTGPECDGKGHYPSGITTINPIENSMNITEITSQGDVPKIPNAKYLTFTQEDKHKMQKAGFLNTNTVDEFQGGRSRHVVLVRLSKTMDVNLRTSSEQFIVAVSRHTERLDYCTVEQPSTLQDLVYKGISRTKAIQNLNAAYGNFTGDLITNATLQSTNKFMGLIGGGTAFGLTNKAPVESINACLEELIPNSTTCNLEFDNSMVEYNEMKLACSGSLRVPLCKIPAILKPRKTLKPRIRTTMPPPRATTVKQSLFSLMKRNLGGTRVASPMDYRTFAKNSLAEMLDTFGVENWRGIVASWEKIVPNQQDFIAWEKIQNTSTISALSRIDPNVAATSLITEMDDYQFILKPMPKAATDAKPLKVYPTVQTVMYHSKLVNSFFGPIIRRADSRFRSLLRTNVLYNKGKNITDIEEFLDENYIRDDGAITVENDFSDYDRSQQEVAHCLDEALLSLLGLDAEDVNLWMTGHNVNTNYNFQLGLRVNLLYQRKSGDVTTAFGNTVLNMVALCHGLRLKRDEFQVAMFLGDDSWLQIKRTPFINAKLRGCSERIAVHFNGEAKLATFKTGYFCGNYIIATQDRIVLMADPVKRAVKLGRWDVKHQKLLQENWISFRDLLRNYDDENAQELLAEAVCERMPKATKGCLKLLIESLNALHNSYKEFLNCYESSVSITNY